MICPSCTHPVPDAPPLATDYKTVRQYRVAFKEWRRTRGPGCRCKRCVVCWDLLDAKGRCTCAQYPYLLRKKTA